MFQLLVLLCFLASLQSRAVTISPVSDLVVANGNVSPDGFNRSLVFAAFSTLSITEVIAGQFLQAAFIPGPRS